MRQHFLLLCFVGFTKNFLFGLFFYFLFMVIAICALYGLLFRKVRGMTHAMYINT